MTEPATPRLGLRSRSHPSCPAVAVRGDPPPSRFGRARAVALVVASIIAPLPSVAFAEGVTLPVHPGFAVVQKIGGEKDRIGKKSGKGPKDTPPQRNGRTRHSNEHEKVSAAVI